MESTREATAVETSTPRTLKRRGMEDHVKAALEILHSPELHETALPHASSLSLLATWDEPPLEIMRALYFVDLAWGSAPGKNEILEIVYRDYLCGGTSPENLHAIAVEMGDVRVQRHDATAKSQRHRAALQAIIALYSDELGALKESWRGMIPKHQHNQHLVKFYRSLLHDEMESTQPWEHREGLLDAQSFPQENSDFLIRAHHLNMKELQLNRAMEELRHCYMGPTETMSNFSPMEAFLGDGEKARRIFTFTALEFHHAPIALHCHHLTLEGMNRFITLSEEYNMEWAIASYDWESS